MYEFNTLAAELGALLLQQNKRISIAESCTAGGFARVLTSVPGSSRWFEFGFVTYSNRAKSRLLGVSPSVFERFGAVSVECVRAMLQGALLQSGADIAVAISGIAGPDGGSEEKPVGTVVIGWGAENRFVVERFQFAGEREQVRDAAVYAALERVLGYLKILYKKT